MMDEARLKEIEEKLPPTVFGAWAVIRDLIAVVRDAWREREEGWDLAHQPAKCGHARANYKDPKWGTPEYEGDEECEACAIQERAARAEAEVKRTVDAHNDLFNQWEQASGECAKLERVREAADIFLKSAFVGAYDDSNAGLVRRAHRIEFDNLCRALDACAKDPAR